MARIQDLLFGVELTFMDEKYLEPRNCNNTYRGTVECNVTDSGYILVNEYDATDIFYKGKYAVTGERGLRISFDSYTPKKSTNVSVFSFINSAYVDAQTLKRIVDESVETGTVSHSLKARLVSLENAIADVTVEFRYSKFNTVVKKVTVQVSKKAGDDWYRVYSKYCAQINPSSQGRDLRQ